MGILSLVLAAIYSTWTSILRASKVGQDAAAAVQRARMAGRILEEALSSAQYFEPQSPAQRDDPYYDFLAQNGSDAVLSFVSHLSSKYFPRSVKFGPWTVRRVIFSVRDGPDGGRELVLAQKPLLWEEFDEDEKNYPLVLAKNVREFKTEFWDVKQQDWKDEWKATNSLPPLVKVTLKLADNPHSTMVREEVTRIVSLPAQGVTRQWQPWSGAQGFRPGMPGTQPGTVNPLQPGSLPPGQYPIGPGQFPGLVPPKGTIR